MGDYKKAYQREKEARKFIEGKLQSRISNLESEFRKLQFQNDKLNGLISDKKILSDELKMSLESPNPMAKFDVDFNLIYSNFLATQIFKFYTKKDLIAKIDDSELGMKSDFDLSDDFYWIKLEFRNRVYAFNIQFDKKESVYKFYGVDITMSSVEMSKHLVLEKKYEEIIETVSDIIYEVDHKGRFVYFNLAAIHLTGYSSVQLSEMFFFGFSSCRF